MLPLLLVKSLDIVMRQLNRLFEGLRDEAFRVAVRVRGGAADATAEAWITDDERAVEPISAEDGVITLPPRSVATVRLRHADD